MLRIFFVLVTMTSLSLPAAFASNPDISEWIVPWEDSRPRDPYVAPDGSIWFVGQRSDYVANLNPLTGNFRQLPLESGAGPHNVIVSKDGTLWYAGNRAAPTSPPI